MSRLVCCGKMRVFSTGYQGVVVNAEKMVVNDALREELKVNRDLSATFLYSRIFHVRIENCMPLLGLTLSD